MDKNRLQLLQAHKKPTTRREFLALGLLSGAASLLPFNLGRWIQSEANAGELTDLVPLLIFDLAGGAALPANFLVGGRDGAKDLLPSYSDLGWKPKSDGFDDRFGAPMAKENVGRIF
ncbi:MAG: hypothetical protein KDD25_02990, partial [Bdellovibrionales bacterium]|nr:hypothetical protein [Bdellovibrionales bacterium]